MACVKIVEMKHKIRAIFLSFAVLFSLSVSNGHFHEAEHSDVDEVECSLVLFKSISDNTDSADITSLSEFKSVLKNSVFKPLSGEYYSFRLYNERAPPKYFL